MQDRLLIRELIENWAVWRDAGDWDRFATVWHDDGWMMTTWFKAPALVALVLFVRFAIRPPTTA